MSRSIRDGVFILFFPPILAITSNGVYPIWRAAARVRGERNLEVLEEFSGTLKPVSNHGNQTSVAVN